MVHFTRSRYLSLGVVLALTLAMSAGPAMAQAQVPPPRPAEPPTAGMLEGSVKKIDPAARTVQVSWGPFGLLGRTLEVTSDTQIQVEGRQGTLADVREGAKVKAAYETREGKNVAKQIEVMPAEAVEKPGAGDKLPGAGQPPAKTQ